ncbi:hypothetical protein MIDIC_50066 [Alphaproteobacteria bacterium]
MFYVYVKHRRDFENLLLYDRFVAVLKRILPILCCLLQCITGEVTGIQFMFLCGIGLIPLPLGEQFSTIFLFYVIQERVSHHI